ncbi:MAG: hypothetical protein QNJ12_15690 [Ilumatobacter sp.]|uniref:MOSC domain-containing protein n=1 Tax=Ilumatobacter sp. TaxID=1967498 RepID=UPI002631D382|nr:MOSC domain-containing protein [Ilumatobacter sp.]MDJ0770243.1 hypothetical protein [Ilumatobacter sp.]
MTSIHHLTTEQLEAGDGHARESPSDGGTVEMIVCRPGIDERRVLEEGRLVVGDGLVGDNYLDRPAKGDDKPHPEAQLNLMNSRVVDLVAEGRRDRWSLAGDQFFVDFDLSADNAPAGTRLSIGTAVIEVSTKPHNGCAKFAERFGIDAARWVNADKAARRRGINAMVVQAGVVRAGDRITKLD